MNNKRAKISDICLTGRQGRHSALTDYKKIVRIHENRTEKLIETRDSIPTIKRIQSNFKTSCNWHSNKMYNERAKISDICLTGRQGRHPVLTDAKNVHVVRIQKNRTEKLIETRESEPTMKLV